MIIVHTCTSCFRSIRAKSDSKYAFFDWGIECFYQLGIAKQAHKWFWPQLTSDDLIRLPMVVYGENVITMRVHDNLFVLGDIMVHQNCRSVENNGLFVIIK